MITSPAKTAEPTGMPFGVCVDLDGPKEPCVSWGPEPSMRRSNFEGKGRPIVKYRDSLP